MGADLIRYSVFRDTLQKIDDVFRSLGCVWCVLDELNQAANINRPEYAQPLCTALQIALLELLNSFGIIPSTVASRSSGEVAVACVIRALSLISGCKVAYYRGQLAGGLKAAAKSPGAMLAVNLPAQKVHDYLMLIGSPEIVSQVHVACTNSPLNSSPSGPEEATSLAKEKLDKDNIFAQKLNTGIQYHSPALRVIEDDPS
ncbi:acyl transferase [Daldinia sp. FL1419]|nr:acyl transferase [Daldinia sp. FL1419]